MTPEAEALLSIRRAWTAWAKPDGIGEVEAMALIAEALELAGVPVIGDVEEVANDE